MRSVCFVLVFCCCCYFFVLCCCCCFFFLCVCVLVFFWLVGWFCVPSLYVELLAAQILQHSIDISVMYLYRYQREKNSYLLYHKGYYEHKTHWQNKVLDFFFFNYFLCLTLRQLKSRMSVTILIKDSLTLSLD